MSAEDIAQFPSTSRFFGRNTPDIKNQNFVRNSKTIHINNVSSNINYQPYNTPQVKTRANYPVDLFNLLNRISVEENDSPAPNTGTTSQAEEIPVFEFGQYAISDPVLFVESVKEAGKKYGAVKLKIPENFDNLFKTNFQINPDVFSFRTNRVLSNPLENELYSRLRFYNELIKFHMNANKPDEPEDKETEEDKSKKDTVPWQLKPIWSSKTLQPEVETKSQLPTSELPGSIQETTNEPVTTEIKTEVTGTDESKVDQPKGKDSLSKSPKHKLPPFLTKLPMMDKRPLDLYDLFRFVVMRGGYVEVINRKLWAQIGRELGYKGKITSSLSSSLKVSYAKILYPLEVFLGERKNELAGITCAKPSAKDDSNNEDEPQKRRKLNIGAPLILGSAKEFRRSIKVKAAKGILLNEPHLMDVKPPVVFSLKEVENGTSPSTSFNLNDGAFLTLFNQSMKPNGNVVQAKKTDELTCPISASAQINNYIKWLATGLSMLQDSSRLESSGKLTSTYTLRQFIEKDAKFQDFLIASNPEVFGRNAVNLDQSVITTGLMSSGAPAVENPKSVSAEQMEQLYWHYMTHRGNHDFIDGMKLENGSSLQNLVSGSGFVRVGDDFVNYKTHLSNISYQANNTVLGTAYGGESNGTNGTSGSSTPTPGDNVKKPGFAYPVSGENMTANSRSESLFLNCQPYISRTISTALSPFNLHNIPILPNSLLGAYGAQDLNNREMVNSSLNTGMTFSTENWRCEDHFTQLCNYHFFGRSKRWYFIPELEFKKFEQLLDEVVARQDSDPETARINSNYRSEDWQFDQLMSVLSTDDEAANIEYEYLLNSLENMVNPYPEVRVRHHNEAFQKLIDRQRIKRQNILYNQEYLITPELLLKAGIRYTTTIQRPGEYVMKYPKTYSSTVSFGFNLSEEVNFASSLWLDYAIEGEDWLTKQGIPPNMLTFRLLINLAHLYETSNGSLAYFDSEVYGKALELYTVLLEKELSMRNSLRERIKIKETTIEGTTSEAESISDDDLLNAFPSKIVVTDVRSHQHFVMTLSSFIEYLDKRDSSTPPIGGSTEPADETKSEEATTTPAPVKSENDELPDIIGDSSYRVELQLFYSDDKLRSYQRLLSGYSIEYGDWVKNYEELMMSNEELPLKTYKTLLLEGQKICSALSSSNDTFRKFSSATLETTDDAETAAKVKTFVNYVNNLQAFVDDSSETIEECQAILSLKHQQRIRNGGSEQSFQHQDQQQGALQTLLDLVNKIPKLNFYAPEFDQIYEFKNEIQNFDRACRTLIQKQGANINELNDMISLGTSFGIKLPSLEFLIRLRDRQKWIDTFEIIAFGGDPFSGKKDIFTLADLEGFRDSGVKVLGSDDVTKLNSIERYLKLGKSYDESVKTYLSEHRKLNSVDLKQLDSVIVDMEEKTKMTGDSRLFVYMETYQKLIDLKAQAGLIEFLNNYSQAKYTLSEIRHFIADLEKCGYEYDDSMVKTAIQKTENWVQNVWNEMKVVKVTTTMRSKRTIEALSDKVASENELLNRLFQIYAKCEANFAGEEVDSFVRSSAYLAAKDMENDYDERTPMRYCLCRDYEEGDMIGCDKCHEWFHVSCVHGDKDLGDNDDKYSCPGCLFLESNANEKEFSSGRITDVALGKLVEAGQALQIIPSAELAELERLNELAKRASEYFQQRTLEQNEADGSLYYHFVYRKLFGAPVIVTNLVWTLTIGLRASLKAAALEADKNPPAPAVVVEAIEKLPEDPEPSRSAIVVPAVAEFPEISAEIVDSALPVIEHAESENVVQSHEQSVVPDIIVKSIFESAAEVPTITEEPCENVKVVSPPQDEPVVPRAEISQEIEENATVEATIDVSDISPQEVKELVDEMLKLEEELEKELAEEKSQVFDSVPVSGSPVSNEAASIDLEISAILNELPIPIMSTNITNVANISVLNELTLNAEETDLRHDSSAPVEVPSTQVEVPMGASRDTVAEEQSSATQPSSSLAALTVEMTSNGSANNEIQSAMPEVPKDSETSKEESTTIITPIAEPEHSQDQKS